MTATQLALGIFFGFGSLEVAKVGLAMFYERQKRKAAHQKLHELMDETESFIDKMHKDLMAEREAEAAKAAKRRKPATKKAPVKKPVAKSVPKQVVKNLPKPTTKKSVTTKKGRK